MAHHRSIVYALALQVFAAWPCPGDKLVTEPSGQHDLLLLQQVKVLAELLNLVKC